jgi:hypothetical protein
MGHLACGGHIREEDKTARLLGLARDDFRALVQGDLQAIPQRFDSAWLRAARPSRAILRALLDIYFHSVIGALQRSQLSGGGFGIRLTAILLSGCCVHAGLQRRVGRLDVTLQVLLPSLVLAARVDHHRPIGLAV